VHITIDRFLVALGQRRSWLPTRRQLSPLSPVAAYRNYSSTMAFAFSSVTRCAAAIASSSWKCSSIAAFW